MVIVGRSALYKRIITAPAKTRDCEYDYWPRSQTWSERSHRLYGSLKATGKTPSRVYLCLLRLHASNDVYGTSCFFHLTQSDFSKLLGAVRAFFSYHSEKSVGSFQNTFRNAASVSKQAMPPKTTRRQTDRRSRKSLCYRHVEQRRWRRTEWQIADSLCVCVCVCVCVLVVRCSLCNDVQRRAGKN